MEIPIPTLHLFPILDVKLIEMLKSLSEKDWSSPTLARQWTVKDIAAHLLDGNLRTLSVQRDNFTGDPATAISSYGDLVAYLNRLNADWVNAMKRVSPAVLMELLELTGQQYYALLSSRDPFAPAVWAVSWAGESQSQNWFHTAREYTEKWHHQQQIREAVRKPGLMTREFYYPMMDTFMRALPHTWRDTPAPEHTAVKVTVSGALGGSWVIVRETDRWVLTLADSVPVVSEVTLDAELAWKLFTKAILPDEAKNRILFRGDLKLGLPILKMLAIMG